MESGKNLARKNQIVELSIEEIFDRKLLLINEELHNNPNWNGSFTEQHMSEMIGDSIRDFSPKEYEELYQFIFFYSHRTNEDFTLEEFNKQYDNLTEEEWDYYYDCILNY